MANSDNAATERTTLDLLIRGFQVSQMIRVIADLGIADRIPSDGQTAAADLAAQCGVRHQPLIRMLRALASLHIFAVTTNENVRHTERSRLLRKDTPGSMHYGARFWAGPGSWRAWGVLDRALKGEVPREVAWGTDRFGNTGSFPHPAKVFGLGECVASRQSPHLRDLRSPGKSPGIPWVCGAFLRPEPPPQFVAFRQGGCVV